MKIPVFCLALIRAVLPALLGAFGGVAATSYPSLHASFCMVAV